MTGPEHYKRAESLLADAARWERDVVDDDGNQYLSINSARLAANAHATLAVAAAQVEAASLHDSGDVLTKSAHDWWEVIW